ncbi:MAG: hypothetical protein IKV25_02895 [Clostridia bacterium]|nr:hypothetical protein [Clostridia bacterium]
MINVWSVSQVLEDSGVLTPEEAKKAMPFCLSACSQLSKRLKDIRNEDEPAVINACAGIALYNYSLLQCSKSDNFSSFKAGDITISKSNNSTFESAVKFRDEALIQASEFLTDVDFVFKAVEV